MPSGLDGDPCAGSPAGGPADWGAKPMNKAKKSGTARRLVPDPLALLLPALSALGAIASIAAVNWVGQDDTDDRSKSRRKSGMVLRDLENCCLGLQEIFRRFQRYPGLFGGASPSASTPMKFGLSGPPVTASDVRAHRQLINDVASMLVLASHNSQEAMSAIEDGEIDAPEDVFFGFSEQQDALNQLIQQRAAFKPTIDMGLEVAGRLITLVRALKTYKVS